MEEPMWFAFGALALFGAFSAGREYETKIQDQLARKREIRDQERGVIGAVAADAVQERISWDQARKSLGRFHASHPDISKHWDELDQSELTRLGERFIEMEPTIRKQQEQNRKQLDELLEKMKSNPTQKL